MIHGSNLRPVVGGDDKLVGGVELEEVLAHESGGQLEIAGQFLDPRFVPVFALSYLIRDGQAYAAQASDIGRVTFAPLRHEHRAWHLDCVRAHDEQ